MSISDDDILQAVGETFRVEADEHIQAINRLLLRLENDGSDDRAPLLDEIAREAHTLKGGASILGLTVVQETAHAMEEVFESLRDAPRDAPPELFDALYSALDLLAEACERLEDPTGEARLALVEAQDLCRRLTAGNGAPPEPPPGDDGSVERSPDVQLEVPEAAADAATGLEADLETSAAESGDAESPPVTAGDSPPSRPDPAPRRDAEETIRVPIRKIDSLMAQIGELLIARIHNDDRLAAIRELRSEVDEATKDWNQLKEVRRALAHATGRRGRTLLSKRSLLLDRMEDHLKTLAHEIAALAQEYSRDAMHMSILTENLQEDIKRARMLPVATVLDGFQRLVRDVARREGKRAELAVVGGEVEVDKRVLELIKDPLMHLLRNAVSHGIEPPVERAERGKPEGGLVTVTTRQAGGQIVVEIADDGRGFDTEAILLRAVTTGLIEAGARPERSELLQLIFERGFSTKEIVTEVSGRGVGMDVVRENIERIQGQIAIDTTPGAGSRVTITLPLTLSTTNCLVVEAGGQEYAIPIGWVERILRIGHDEVRLVEDTPAISLDGAPVAVARLTEVLGVAEAPGDAQTKLPVVVVSADGRRLGLVVDGLVDERELVVKPLGRQLASVRNVAGGTIVGSGAVVLVLNPIELVRNAAPSQTSLAMELESGRAAPTASRRRRVVVAEDSITTRTLAKSILETAGYEVVPCKDGVEALRFLLANAADALVTDLDMPNMDGIALVERVRKLDAHRDLPVVVLSSHGSDDDKRRGMRAGANGYIVKAEFDQTRFLETLGALL